MSATVAVPSDVAISTVTVDADEFDSEIVKLAGVMLELPSVTVTSDTERVGNDRGILGPPGSDIVPDAGFTSNGPLSCMVNVSVLSPSLLPRIDVASTQIPSITFQY